VAAREDGLTHEAHALSLSHANACNPLLQAHPPWAQDNTKAAVSPYCFPPPCVPSRADPSGLGHAATIYSSVQGPLGVETPTTLLLTAPHNSPNPGYLQYGEPQFFRDVSQLEHMAGVQQREDLVQFLKPNSEVN
jgi:hypothetical protein